MRIIHLIVGANLLALGLVIYSQSQNWPLYSLMLGSTTVMVWARHKRLNDKDPDNNILNRKLF